VADIWYPSCWVRFQLRFEDYIRAPPVLPQPKLPNGDPVDQGGFQTVDLQIVPEQVNLTLSSYRKADEVRITIPYGRLPIDPRMLRQATIQVYMGGIKADEYAKGIGQLYGDSRQVLVPETETGSKPAGGGLSIDEPQTNELFRGFIDDWEITQDGEDRIDISGRDITAIMIDAEMPTGGLSDIPASMPIDQVIRLVIEGDKLAQTVPPDRREDRPRRVDGRRDSKRLAFELAQLDNRIARVTAQLVELGPRGGAELARLQAQRAKVIAKLASASSVSAAVDAVPILAARYGLPSMRGVEVVNATGEPLPTIGQVKGATWRDSAGKAKRAKAGGSGEQISYWDFITDLCVGVGLICYVRTPVQAEGALGSLPPAQIVIDRPKTYYREAKQETREFVYGRNIDRLSVSRSYNGRDVPTGVVVNAIEAKTGQHISARFPPLPDNNRPSANPVGLGDRAEYMTINLDDRIPGDKAVETLQRKAQTVFEQVARGEIKVTVETRSLSAYPSTEGTGVPDLFQLRAGDPVAIAVVPSLPVGAKDGTNPVVTTAGNFWKAPTPERIAFYVDVLGMSPVVAAQLARSSASELLQSTFYTREVGIDFNAQTGFRFTVEAVNYVDARYDDILAEDLQATARANLPVFRGGAAP